MEQIKTTKIVFDYKIVGRKIALFRGAISSLAGRDDVFHNHSADGVNYRYPKIQYKTTEGDLATILGINEGADALTTFIGEQQEISATIGKEHKLLKIKSIDTTQHELNATSTCMYKIASWLSLNSGNYKEYMAKTSLAERIAMLESILKGNILSFAKGVGVFFESRIECFITDIGHGRIIKYKNVDLMEFDAQFRTNVSLPPYIGLGKLVSLGHGTITPKHK